VLTCLGKSFAGRVAGCLLQAIDLPELIADSLSSYEAMALKLAREPKRLAAVKAKLENNRNTQPLFDTARFTKHLETAFTIMWERQQRGERPKGFAVPSIT
jgi:predicted O-linked N-acetylglucosamine transferase (SPINDLY family)